MGRNWVGHIALWSDTSGLGRGIRTAGVGVGVGARKGRVGHMKCRMGQGESILHIT